MAWDPKGSRTCSALPNPHPDPNPNPNPKRKRKPKPKPKPSPNPNQVSSLPAELAEFAGVYELLHDVSSGGDPVFGRRCNAASRHRNECDAYLF